MAYDSIPPDLGLLSSSYFGQPQQDPYSALNPDSEMSLSQPGPPSILELRAECQPRFVQ